MLMHVCTPVLNVCIVRVMYVYVLMRYIVCGLIVRISMKPFCFKSILFPLTWTNKLKDNGTLLICTIYLNFREIRLNPAAVASEVEVLQQFCGASSNHCLQSLQYTSGILSSF